MGCLVLVTELILILTLGMCCLAAERRGRSMHRIIGGELAVLGDVPWQASIRAGGEHLCGACIVHQQFVLTAAHCVFDKSAADLTIWAGFLNHDNPGRTVQKVNVSRITTHEKYKEHLETNDIAILKLASPFYYNSYVSKINLPTSDVYVASGDALVSGWGSTVENGPTSKVLYKLIVPIIPWLNCTEFYSEDFDKSLICAGYVEGGKDACQGDSGGPLACPTDDGAKVLCGVVAAGQGCAWEERPGVYTSTASHLTWINNKLNNYKQYI